MPEANRLPNSNDQMRMREQKVRSQKFDAANLARKRQIVKDADDLLTLAIALKAEVDRSQSQPLSPNALRKADGIEKLAHDVRDKMGLSVGSN